MRESNLDFSVFLQVICVVTETTWIYAKILNVENKSLSINVENKMKSKNDIRILESTSIYVWELEEKPSDVTLKLWLILHVVFQKGIDIAESSNRG